MILKFLNFMENNGEEWPAKHHLKPFAHAKYAIMVLQGTA